MGDMQKKVLAAIKDRAAKVGLEFVDQPNHSNTGTVFLMVGMDAMLSFHYDFQPLNATLQFYPRGKKVQWTCGFTHKDCVLHSHLNYGDLFGEMNKIYKLVDAWKSDQKEEAV